MKNKLEPLTMNKKQIVGKTIKWTSGGKQKTGTVMGIILPNHDVLIDFPFLNDVPTARITRLGSLTSINNRLLVKVTTPTGLAAYYGPLVPVENVKQNIWLPKNAEVIK
jgi:hypothetical protein